MTQTKKILQRNKNNYSNNYNKITTLLEINKQTKN